MCTYCPQCRCEYRAGFDVCSDCGVALVEDLPPLSVPEEEVATTRLGPDVVTVWSGYGEMDAHVTSSMLRSHGISSEVWTAGLGANVQFDALVAHRVVVARTDGDTARGLIESLPTAGRTGGGRT
jgi:hypothetical protein